jgi:hypothetical protein
LERTIIFHFPHKIQNKHTLIPNLHLIAVNKYLNWNSKLWWNSIHVYLLFILFNFRQSQKLSLFVIPLKTVFKPKWLHHMSLFACKLKIFKYPGHKEKFC